MLGWFGIFLKWFKPWKRKRAITANDAKMWENQLRSQARRKSQAIEVSSY